MRRLSKPLPDSWKYTTRVADDYAFLKEEVEEKSELQGWTFPLGPGWIDISSPLADFGREFAYHVGLWDLKSHPEDARAKRLLVLDEIVLTYYQGLVSSIVSHLKRERDAAEKLRAKLFALAGMGVMSAITCLLNTYLLTTLRADLALAPH